MVFGAVNRIEEGKRQLIVILVSAALGRNSFEVGKFKILAL